MRTKAFKSGNSVAVRIPKSFGLVAGTELIVSREDSGYLLKPNPPAAKIDLSGIAGSMPWLKPLTADEREFDEGQRPWDKLSPRD